MSPDARRLRVVHVITTLTTGGAERQLESLAAASRHDVSVVALYGGGVVADALATRGIPVEVLGMDGWRKAVAVPRLARVLRRLRPDVVHVHLLSAQLWGIPAARLARVPVIVSTEHSIMDTTIEGRPKTEWLRRLYRGLERLTTHTVAVSEATRRRLAEWGLDDPQRLTVLNPPIEFAEVSDAAGARAQVRSGLGIPAEATVIGAVGRLDPVKRPVQLLRALTDRLDGGAHLVLVGDGPLRTELEQAAAAAGVAGAVHLTGPRPDVRRILEAVDVLVSLSRDETFGMAVVEALGAGLPVVYAECPALDDLALPPGRAVQLARDSDEPTESSDLGAALDTVLLHAAERVVPPELVRRYSAQGTAAVIDDLYLRLAR